MRLIRLAAAALNQTPLDWDSNAENIRSAIEMARQRKAQVLCLPELSITGYGCEDAFFSYAVRATASEMLHDLAPLTNDMVVAFGLPWEHAGALYNASAIAVDGQLRAVVMKQRLAGDGLHYEPRWFKPWPTDAVTSVDFYGDSIPAGDLVIDVGGIRIGLEICEDAWVAERPARDHSLLAADVILNPSASHFAFGKAKVRERLVAEASRAFCVSYVYSNLLGNEAGRVIYDGHTLIANHGELISSGPRLGFEPVQVCDAVVDVHASRMRRIQSHSHAPEIIDDDERLIRVDMTLAEPQPAVRSQDSTSWETSADVQQEEFTRAVGLGLFDYLRKSRSRGFVVSLSGGADSAAVACLVALAIRLGLDELGVQRFCTRLGIEPPTVKATQTASEAGGMEETARLLCRRLLTTAYQATANSSERTRSAAEAVAMSIGAEHMELDVEDLNALYCEKIQKALGRELSWDTDDITLQNIQARVRGPSVWMLANAKKALLLATSNRSEAAVGYATMDGDTCGGISPIAGIDKAFLRHWLRWLESTGPRGLGPIAGLNAVNQLQPTAELRPASEDQTDEDDLMPYDVLDAVEHHAIGEKRAPDEVLKLIAVSFSQYDRQQLVRWVRRFFELWSRNQWKRERYAPSFHVDDKNLDPKTWCRFPILSGGFRRELRTLEQCRDQN